MSMVFLDWFMERYDYPAEAREALRGAYRHLSGIPAARQLWADCAASYPAHHAPRDVSGLFNRVHEVSGTFGVPYETVELLFFILLAEPLRDIYREEGISEAIYDDTMLDLRAKLVECHKVYGIWGSFVAFWLVGFFALGRFGIGRLEYEPETKDALTLPDGRRFPGGRCLDVHIPSRGRLTKENIEDSFRRAEVFFRDRIPGDMLAFFCHSWLLYPPHREMLLPDSGICTFMDFFTIYASEESPDRHDLWRIFDTMETRDFSKFPRRTTLQRQYLARLEAGLPVGSGRGVRLVPKSDILP